MHCRRNHAAILLLASLALLPSLTASAQHRDGRRDGRAVSPVRGIDGRHTGGHGGPERAEGFPSLDGTGHNEADPEMGAAGTALMRLVPSDYGDDISSLSGADRPGPRTISNTVFAQDASTPNALGVSDFLWQWGQFVDHDIDFSDGTDPPEAANIAIPAGDAWFDPDGDGDVELSFNRTIYDESTGSETPREQLNEITGWLDGSNVYGSDTERASALRTNDGTGTLATSDGDLLPFNTTGLANAGGPGDTFFLAGDVRANEQVGLTALHTLFVREHNRLAAEIGEERPHLTGEEIYQEARLRVIAELQVITYREFLPALLGPNALPRYRGYDADVDASIANLFSTAAYRFGHSALSATLLRLDETGTEIGEGHLALRDAFFAPTRITDEGGIEPLLRGLASQACQEVDAAVIDDVRNFLFGNPGHGGFDLASLNIQRGRDHGLPSYPAVRAALGLTRPASFSDVSSDPDVQSRLAAAYGDIEAMDVWVGGLAEDRLPGAMVGELVATLVSDQFAALRDGDRFWYERTLDREARREAESTRLADVIRRNTEIDGEIPDDVFRVGFLPSPPPARGGRGDRRR